MTTYTPKTQVVEPPTRQAPAATTADRRRPASGFRPDIEGLRAIAVGLVVLGHAGFPYLDGGYIGVDVFFVISGFLITSLLLRELTGTGKISVVGFYARRATRLLPMAATVTVATLVASWLWLAPTRFASIVGDAVASSVYFVNYRLAIEGTEYLNADAAPSPFQHFWSLAVEEQFYLVWPLLLLAVALILRKRRDLVRDGLTVVLIAIVGTTFAASAVLSESDPVWSYFGLHTRGWELAIGALVAITAAACARMPRSVAAVLMWGGLAALGWAAFNYDEHTVFPGVAAAVPVVATAAVIAGGCAETRLGAGGLLGLPAFQVLGKYSYGLYLWHWPVLMIGPAALGLEASVRINLMLVAAAIGLTALTHEIIENPVRFAAFFKRRPWRGVGLGATLTAASAAFAIAAGTLLSPQATGQGAPVETPEIDSVEELHALVSESVGRDATPSNLVPAPLDAPEDRPLISLNDCHADPEVVDLPGCHFGEVGSETSVMLLGDSHAAHWFSTLDLLAIEQGWDLEPMTKSACPAPTVITNSNLVGGRYTECEEFREKALDHIVESRPDLVVVASSEHANPAVGDGEDRDEVWLEGWSATLERLQESGAEIVVLSNPPWYDVSVPDCVSANLDDPSVCDIPPEDAFENADRELRVLEQAEETGAHAISVRDWFCADGVCPVIVGNRLVFRDGHHLTASYAEFLAPVLLSEFPDF